MKYCVNSKDLESGDIFVCLPGGEKYINTAYKKGAVAVLFLTREELSFFAAELYDHPSRKMTVVGVTGTNGKTTVTHLVGKVLEDEGHKPYVLGTINSELTTPESIDIQRLMSEHYRAGGTHFVLEVSSHAIAQGRVLGIDFDIKALTNITQDHLDYHKTLEEYKKTKLRFMSGGDKRIFPEDYEKEQIFFKTKLAGAFNIKNIKAAMAILGFCGIGMEAMAKSLSKAVPPPGRFETIDEGQTFKVIVDYAHTPDGLSNVLSTAKELLNDKQARLITVFGCGGDRDRLKRPKMGCIATSMSDYVIVTQDNPRTESQSQIIDDVLEGISEDGAFEVINDRAKAIKIAINIAQENDIIMIAGKGHETYQIFGTETIHFDDREEARLAIRRRLDGCID
ncbi:Mur ligase family protein [Candidatus Margulisiibacteriota bacterium]